MFITEKERCGTAYIEFSFCKAKSPVYHGKVRCGIVKNRCDNSLLLSATDAEDFFNEYRDTFDCAILPNGETGFDFCGINYYSPEIAMQLAQSTDFDCKKYAILTEWLRTAGEYNGFYILGL